MALTTNYTFYRSTKMRLKKILFFCSVGLTSCVKDPVIPVQNVERFVCGTEGWPQVNVKVKYVVTGATIPDSVNFNINDGQAQFGTVYYKTFPLPSLPLSDSTIFCGDLNSDIILDLFNQDTSKVFTGQIYVDDSLVAQAKGYRLFLVAGAR